MKELHYIAHPYRGQRRVVSIRLKANDIIEIIININKIEIFFLSTLALEGRLGTKNCRSTKDAKGFHLT